MVSEESSTSGRVFSHNTLSDSTSQAVNEASLLVVGAGGIGCELLKNLVLSGFEKIEIIDLDTIDVSNLNRQFLFQKKHVSKSKAMVARESVLRFNPRAVITAHHDTVMNPSFDADYFRSFTLVLNALDNKAARFHVNRMCLAAGVPLVESGSAGYLGQVTVIRKGITECYECQPKPTQKTFPGCTIRNTPSEPVHCIVWAKHLFNQLFGEFDADNEVSPDTADPELAGEAGQNAASENGEEAQRKSTREWANEIGYDATKLFNKFFESDIHYLLSMEKLWLKRTAPQPLSFERSVEEAVTANNTATTNNNSADGGLADKRVWALHECAQTFSRCVGTLSKQSTASEEPLVWDKDDEVAMDFVAATANIRSHIFHIKQQSRFDVKSMAGNIIPAIATTNAVIGGLMVMEALKLLARQFSRCSTVYLNHTVNRTRNRLLGVEALAPPNPRCYVCAPKPEVTVHLDLETFTCAHLEDRLLKEKLGMVAPDVEIDNGTGTVLIDSDGETSETRNSTLASFGIKSGSRLQADDFLQDYQLTVVVRQRDDIEPPAIFLLEGEIPVPVPATEEKPAAATADAEMVPVENNGAAGGSMRKRKLSGEPDEVESPEAKRRKSEVNGGGKKNGITQELVEDDDELIIL